MQVERKLVEELVTKDAQEHQVNLSEEEFEALVLQLMVTLKVIDHFGLFEIEGGQA